MEGKGNRESLCSKRGARADCVDVVTDLATARSRWEALEARGSATAFQSFTWGSTLANSVGRSLGAETFVVIVREDAS